MPSARCLGNTQFLLLCQYVESFTEPEECSSNPCLNGGTCLETTYGYVCECADIVLSKYTGTHCEIGMTPLGFDTFHHSPVLESPTHTAQNDFLWVLQEPAHVTQSHVSMVEHVSLPLMGSSVCVQLDMKGPIVKKVSGNHRTSYQTTKVDLRFPELLYIKPPRYLEMARHPAQIPILIIDSTSYSSKPLFLDLLE